MNDVGMTFSVVKRFMNRGTYPRMLFMLVSRALILYGTGELSAPVMLMLLYGALESDSILRIIMLAVLWLVYAYWMVAGDRRNMVEYNRIYFRNQVNMQSHYLRCALALKLPVYDEKYRQGMLVELLDDGVDRVMMRFQDFFSMLVKGLAVAAIVVLIGITGSVRLSLTLVLLAGMQIIICGLIDKKMKVVSGRITELQAMYKADAQVFFGNYECYACAGLQLLWYKKLASSSDERLRAKRCLDGLGSLQALVCGTLRVATYAAICIFVLNSPRNAISLMALPIGYRALNDALTDFVRALSSIRSESHLTDRLNMLESESAQTEPTTALPFTAGLLVEHLSVKFGEKKILDDVSLRVDNHDHVMLLGGNGSGKSTLLRTIAGLINPDAGGVRLNGMDTSVMPQVRRWREFAYMPSQGALLPVSCAENIELVSIDPKHARELARKLGLDIDMDATVPDMLSLGQRQRLEVCRALCSDAPWLFLDEPTAHMDRDTAKLVWDEVFASNKGIIATAHEYVDVVKRYAPRTEWIKK